MSTPAWEHDPFERPTVLGGRDREQVLQAVCWRLPVHAEEDCLAESIVDAIEAVPKTGHVH